MNANEIRDEIKRLEKEETTYPNCSKLAVLYKVIEHIGEDEKKQDKVIDYSYASSEFLSAVSNAPIPGVLEILDEHMGAVQVLYPKEYAMVIRKIKELSLL